jgi:catechol 2,3-dioxygenase-like lactoylglutathione lyase family enzyme
MNLNHVDLPVADITGVRAFFEKYFGFRCVFERDDGLTVLLDSANFALTLSALQPGQNQTYPSGFHVGFNLQSEAALNAAYMMFLSDGVEIVMPLGDLGGAQTFHCHAPGDLLVEVAWRPR